MDIFEIWSRLEAILLLHTNRYPAVNSEESQSAYSLRFFRFFIVKNYWFNFNIVKGKYYEVSRL